ncbi:MAG: universal stress protein [Bacteroidales bacterium]|nr:universal stress protein [Bacteroidales bacterium]
MIENKILIPVDFSVAADKAVEFGVFLAKNSHFNISLLHVFEDDGLSLDACENKLREMAEKINATEDIFCDYHCEKGNIFNLIPDMASRSAFRMMVIATHGRKGIRQKFFGPDILKLLKQIPIPTLVVQENSIVPEDGFKSVIFPVGGHDKYDKKVEAMVFMAGLFDPEIHLYSISKPGFEQTEKLRDNISLAEARFSEKGIRYKRVAEDQSVFSVGFAKQTLLYADKSGADLITVMANPTRENYYFADSDKEALLTNEHNIPVLCASNAEVEI